MTTLPYFTIGHGPPVFHHSRVNIGTLAAEREPRLSPPVVALECETLPTTLAYRRRRTNVFVLQFIFPMPFSPSTTPRIAHLRHLMHSSTAARSLDLRSADGSMRKTGRRIDTRIGRPDTISNRCHVAPCTTAACPRRHPYRGPSAPHTVGCNSLAGSPRGGSLIPAARPLRLLPRALAATNLREGPGLRTGRACLATPKGAGPSGASTQGVPLVAVRLGGHCRPRVASAGGSKHGDEWLRMRGTLHRRVAPFSRNAAGNPRRSHAMRPSSPTRGGVLTEQPTPAARLGGPKTRLSSRKGLDALAKPTLHWLPV